MHLLKNSPKGSGPANARTPSMEAAERAIQRELAGFEMLQPTIVRTNSNRSEALKGASCGNRKDFLLPCPSFFRCCGFSCVENSHQLDKEGLCTDPAEEDCEYEGSSRVYGYNENDWLENGFYQSYNDSSSGEEGTRGDEEREAGAKKAMMKRRASLHNSRLLDEYTLGELLGQGSFGIVFACSRRVVTATRSMSNVSGARKLHDDLQDGMLAVKLIDRVESRPEDIEREVKIHGKLSHKNILKVASVINERCFVCIVMERLAGGDLVHCLARQHSQGASFRRSKIQHVVKQMLEATAYLHDCCIVHRDIKPDNFLLDGMNILDPQVRVILADFGFAVECRTGDRLRRRCGTIHYWPPELWDRSYALKVDVWALGVTVYAMIEGHFPFRNEWDVKNKKVECHPFVLAAAADLMKKLLSKLEAQRPAALDALRHDWITQESPSGETTEGAQWVTALRAWQQSGRDEVGTIQAEKPSLAVVRRRLELIERLEDADKLKTLSEKGSSSQSSHSGYTTRRRAGGGWAADVNEHGGAEQMTSLATLRQRNFTVHDSKANKERTFEWMPRQKAELEGFTKLVGSNTIVQTKQMDAQVVRQLLESQGVGTALFGKGGAKPIERFADELEKGASQLMTDATKHKALVRVVDVVLLRLVKKRHGLTSGADKSLYLIVTDDEQIDGSIRPGLNRLPGTKKLPHENMRNAMERILMEMPETLDCAIVFDFGQKEVYEEYEESPSYPGVRTIYRKEIVEGSIDEHNRHAAISEEDVDGVVVHRAITARSTKFFSWLTKEECFERNVKLWAHGKEGDHSCLVSAPCGLNYKGLGKYLQANNINVSAFGKNPTKTLTALSNELSNGESNLMVNAEGKLIRVVDLVILVLQKSGTDDILVVSKEALDCIGEQSNFTFALNRLPGTKRFPAENHFVAAKRILKHQLMISEDHVNFDANADGFVEETADSPSYPGLLTVYRKRILQAHLNVSGDAGLTISSGQKG